MSFLVFAVSRDAPKLGGLGARIGLIHFPKSTIAFRDDISIDVGRDETSSRYQTFGIKFIFKTR